MGVGRLEHQHRYHGVSAPFSPLRPAVTAHAGLPLEVPLPSKRVQEDSPASEEMAETRRGGPGRHLWGGFHRLADRPRIDTMGQLLAGVIFIRKCLEPFGITSS